MRILCIGIPQTLHDALTIKMPAIVDHCYDLYDADNFLRFRTYDLLLLNVSEPLDSVLRFIDKHKKRSFAAPLLAISKTADKQRQIALLHGGVDDFLVENVDVEVLVARCKVLLKYPMDGTLKYEKLDINTAAQTVKLHGEPLKLPNRHLNILLYFIRHRNRLLSKERLLNAFWEEPEYISNQTVEFVIHQIRKEFKARGFACIHAQHKKGYRFKLEAC